MDHADMPMEQAPPTQEQDAFNALSCRELFWSELDADGKLERMREQVKILQHQVNILREQVDKLMSHQHHEGKLVTPLDLNATMGVRGFVGGIPKFQRQGEYF